MSKSVDERDTVSVVDGGQGWKLIPTDDINQLSFQQVTFCGG